MAEKKYVSDNAQLMAEWDWDSNNDLELNPNRLLSGSNKKAWWKCGKGHKWSAVIHSRFKGVGCPYCSNRYVWKGYNDLETTHPQLAKEWHPDKNGTLLPDHVTSGSDKKVWWLGLCGHEWESKVANRTHGNGCPICKNAKISLEVSRIHLSKSGSLEDTHPNLAKEWHPEKNGKLLPIHLTAGSSQLVWWIGECGHDWRASPSNRSKGTNCPYCSNQKVWQRFNDLETLFPDIAKEWHPTLNEGLTPKDTLATSNKIVWWQGRCGHEWKQKVSHRSKRQQGCPVCAKRLQTSFPEQALFYYIKKILPDTINKYEAIFDNQMELDIFIPSLNIGIEYDGINWHKDANSIRREREKYFICKENGIKLIRVRESAVDNPTDFCDVTVYAKRHPAPMDLNETIITVLKILDLAATVDTAIDTPEIRESYLGSVMDKSLLIHRPDIAAAWHPTRNGKLTPDMFTEHSGLKVWWQCCECSNEWEAPIARESAGSGCPVCGIKKRNASRIRNLIEREGSLANNNVSLAEEWHPNKNTNLFPKDVMRSSAKKVWWQCKVCGHEWEATVNSRARGNGCPKCAKIR